MFFTPHFCKISFNYKMSNMQAARLHQCGFTRWSGFLDGHGDQITLLLGFRLLCYYSMVMLKCQITGHTRDCVRQHLKISISCLLIHNLKSGESCVLWTVSLVKTWLGSACFPLKDLPFLAALSKSHGIEPQSAKTVCFSAGSHSSRCSFSHTESSMSFILYLCMSVCIFCDIFLW